VFGGGDNQVMCVFYGVCVSVVVVVAHNLA